VAAVMAQARSRPGGGILQALAWLPRAWRLCRDSLELGARSGAGSDGSSRLAQTPGLIFCSGGTERPHRRCKALAQPAALATPWVISAVGSA